MVREGKDETTVLVAGRDGEFERGKVERGDNVGALLAVAENELGLERGKRA